MFRPATFADIPFITGLLVEFYAKTGGIYNMPLDTRSVVKTVAEVLQEGRCLVGPSSCAGAIMRPFPWNHAALVARVVFWYFRSPREIRILDAMIEDARSAGATHINLASQYPNNHIQRHYAKYGLKPAEIQSIGEL